MDELDNLLQDLEVSKSGRTTDAGTDVRAQQQEADLASLISDIRRTDLANNPRATQDTSFSARPSNAGVAQAVVYEEIAAPPSTAQRASVMAAVPQPQRVQMEEISLTPSNAQRASAVPVAQPQTISYEPAPAVDYMAAPQRVQRAVVTKVAPKPAPVVVQPQRIEVEEVRIPEQPALPPIGFGGQNRYDEKGTTFSNYVEAPKPETLVEDPREHQVNAVVKKLIASIQGKNPPEVVQSLKTIPVLARSEPNMRSMKKGNILQILFSLMNSSPHDNIVEFAGKAVEGLVQLSPDGMSSEIDANGGFKVIVGLCSHTNPAVQLQSLRIAGKLARKSGDKRYVANAMMPFLVRLLSDSHTGLRHQSCTILYHLFESSATHQVFVDSHGAKPMLNLLSNEAGPGSQVWALGAIGRLTASPNAFAAMMNAGLEISLLDVTTSRAALIQNAINILNGPGDLRQKFQRVEQEVRPILAKEADK